MTKPLVLLCDDQPETLTDWLETIATIEGNDRYEFELLPDFAATIELLETRRRAARPDMGIEWPAGKTRLDEAAIILVDWDLIKLKDNPYLTGERVCYLARCYSKCGLIVALNQLGRNSFDLTLRADVRSFADLNVGSDQLTHPGLWGSSTTEGFHPWAWSTIPEMAARHLQRVQDVEAHPDQPVMSHLELGSLSQLPRLLRAPFEGPKRGEERKLVELHAVEGFGLEPGDQAREADQPRIAAARLAKWLNGMILRSQDVIVDLPHAVQRNPALLRTSDRFDPEPWAEASRRDDSSFAALIDIATSFRYLTARPFWLDRPALDFDRLAQSADCPDPWDVEYPDWLFCEDVSRFLAREETESFLIDFSAALPTRYVASRDTRTVRERFVDPPLDTVDYRPASRLST